VVPPPSLIDNSFYRVTLC